MCTAAPVGSSDTHLSMHVTLARANSMLACVLIEGLVQCVLERLKDKVEAGQRTGVEDAVCEEDDQPRIDERVAEAVRGFGGGAQSIGELHCKQMCQQVGTDNQSA